MLCRRDFALLKSQGASLMTNPSAKFCAIVVFALPVFGVAAGLQREYVKTRLLVKFEHNLSESDAAILAGKVNGKLGSSIGKTGYRLLNLPASANAEMGAQKLKGLKGIAQIEFDYKVKPDELPNDPNYGSQWHLSKMACPAAWSYTKGNGVIIAILDTGVDGTHPDLSGKLVGGWNVFDNNSNYSDVYGHGTAVAGTAAASTNNSIGVAGTAWNCSIMPIRISDANGYGYSSTVASGLIRAADSGARVANVSYDFSTDPVVADAAKYFCDKGGVLTMSAGNDGYASPANDNPYVLTISATDSSDALASWSNRGNNIDLAAPGVYIYTTTRGGGYGAWNGTSFSAPAVAGVAGLVLSANPNLNGYQVQDVLKQSAVDRGTAGWDNQFGWGLVNASNAVQKALTYSGDTTAPSVSFSSPTEGAQVSGSCQIFVSAIDNLAVNKVLLYKDGLLVNTMVASPYVYNYDSTKDANGAHSFLAIAYDNAGNNASKTLNISVLNEKDTIAPTVSIISPTSGKIGTTTTVYVNAQDNVGVVSAKLFVDGKLVVTSTSSPFTLKWNSRKASSGTHTLQVIAYDAAGNAGSSQVVTLTK